MLAWRQFGWRLYGKIGCDFREKGAASRMRKALQRNAFVTVLKINAMFLVRRLLRLCCKQCGVQGLRVRGTCCVCGVVRVGSCDGG